MNCDQGQSAAAISTTSSRNDLLIVPCSVMRSVAERRARQSAERTVVQPGIAAI